MSQPPNDEELKLARALVSPDESVRNKSVKALETYVKSIKDFDDLDMLKLWKALFYCFWYSDKVPIQNQLAAVVAELIHKFSKFSLALLFFKGFLQTMVREWHCIDQYRINKFYNLIR
jgi:ribosomal RNA-processing protein 1